MSTHEIERRIIVKFEFKGLHCWPTIPAEQSEQYLKNPHRHTFTVTMETPVTHDDRELEIIAVRDGLLAYVDSLYARLEGAGTYDLGSSSCEQIAEAIAAQVVSRYRRPWAIAEVLEDGECGARVLVGAAMQ